jgi:hypothetical protein
MHVTLLFVGAMLLVLLAPRAELAEVHERLLTGSRLH